MKKAIIIGASSGIGRGLVKQLVNKGYIVGIVGRRGYLLNELKEKFSASVVTSVYDCTKVNNQEKLDNLSKALGGVDLLILSAGIGYLNQSLDLEKELSTNKLNVEAFTEVVNWSFKYFKDQNGGQLVVVSSVAGLRGGKISPAYNASKSYQINYLEGLKQKIKSEKLAIDITDIRPGFVDTEMAKGEGLFWVTPIDKAVSQIMNAIDRKRSKVYVSKRWQLVACMLMLLPSFLFVRL